MPKYNFRNLIIDCKGIDAQLLLTFFGSLSEQLLDKLQAHNVCHSSAVMQTLDSLDTKIAASYTLESQPSIVPLAALAILAAHALGSRLM